jgi:muramoyltetrapeptide carboxypeptidase LdcA involved in peptidoglycan recycling
MEGNMASLKPARLQQGDTIGIASPSWGGAGLFPHRVAQGVRQLEALGFRVKLAEHALKQHGFVSDTPENRAADLHALFADPEVRGILAAIGGDHACHLLPLLDFDLIRAHPKVFIGYSDITVLNVAIWARAGLVTFNGPMLLTDFAEYPHVYDYTLEYFRKAACRAEPVGRIEPAQAWTEEFLDWSRQLDLERPRALQPSSGWRWLRPGLGQGRLVGGCLESLEHLRGTPYWPDWDGSIFFFETSEEKPPPERVDSLLMDYENMGVLEKLRGLVVGRPLGYTAAQKAALHQVILERTRAYDFPILAEADFGHTAPQLTLPLGVRARLDGDPQEFSLLEAAVVD